MDDFWGGECGAETAAAAAERPAAPACGRWDGLAAPFRAAVRGETGDVCPVVSADGPLVPYGQSCGALRRFARRLARKSVRWYVEPLVHEQNRVNRALLDEIAALRRRVDELEGKNGK